MAIDKNPKKITKIFNEISSYYDFMNNLISFGLHYFIKIIAVNNLKIKKNSKVLDLACGTGDIVKIISKKEDIDITGLDISEKMLDIAKKKNPDKKFIEGDILNLPFLDSEFDYVTITFGLRNIENRQKALSEIYRVLKNKGRFLHLDFGEHNFISKIFDTLTPFIVKIFNKDKASYEYLIKSKNDFLQPDDLVEEFKNAGFKLLCKKYCLFKTISFQIMEKAPE
ncbi:MAG: ubiquinone/menaquinone biosynthesis methyltransferase [Candidatus Gastranaerophilales bacterium]|nr:ubiquinone/menaquinone biosynthesis methyltransferase [Candidatus Gastranaerophilales bacterium]